MGRAGLTLPFLVFLAACSPVYVLKSASGHGALLWRSKPISRVLADEKAPASLKERLRLVEEVRRFAFSEMGLAPSRDYTSYTELDRPYVTVLVTASEKTRLRQRQWWFPFVGRVPYKGHFSLKDASREKRALERKGYDVYLAEASAYNTPLWFSDPLPSPVLDYSAGALAALLIHELAHGTVFFKNAMEFNESVAEFIGNRGAEDFLVRRFGAASPELAALRASAAKESEAVTVFDELHARLVALYSGPLPDDAKLKAREEHFAWGRGRLAGIWGEPPRVLNNATVLAHRVYRGEAADFEAAHRSQGGQWPKTIAFFKSLDRRNPKDDLKSKLAIGVPSKRE